ncbi:MAG: hypothetical protein JO252_21740 [Planctomycetaceae bacterium]|nr:hypothetical protein [Planctomycetaceae bacterium]
MASTTWIRSRAEITPPAVVRYTLNVWHEMIAPLRKAVVVDEKGEEESFASSEPGPERLGELHALSKSRFPAGTDPRIVRTDEKR